MVPTVPRRVGLEQMKRENARMPRKRAIKFEMSRDPERASWIAVLQKDRSVSFLGEHASSPTSMVSNAFSRTNYAKNGIASRIHSMRCSCWLGRAIRVRIIVRSDNALRRRTA